MTSLMTIDRCIADMNILLERMSVAMREHKDEVYVSDIDSRAVQAAIVALDAFNMAEFDLANALRGEDDE